MNVSIFRNLWEPQPLGNREVEETLEVIADPPPSTKDAIIKFRETGDVSIKKKQPLITWGGTFKDRQDLRINEPSNHVYIDIDQYMDKEELIKLPFIKAVWSSISNEGIGALVETEQMRSDSYQPTFKMIAAKLEKKGIVVDHSCCNISRGNFLSYDKDLYYNPNSELVSVAKPSITANFTETFDVLPFDKAWSYCMNRSGWFDTVIGFEHGKKHNFSLRFFGSCAGNGVPQKIAWEFWMYKYAYLSNDIEHHLRILKQIYKAERKKHGQF